MIHVEQLATVLSLIQLRDRPWTIFVKFMVQLVYL